MGNAKDTETTKKNAHNTKIEEEATDLATKNTKTAAEAEAKLKKENQVIDKADKDAAEVAKEKAFQDKKAVVDAAKLKMQAAHAEVERYERIMEEYDAQEAALKSQLDEIQSQAPQDDLEELEVSLLDETDFMA